MRIAIVMLIAVVVLVWLFIAPPDVTTDVQPSGDRIESTETENVIVRVGSELPGESISPSADVPVIAFPNGNSYEILLRPAPQESLDIEISAADYFQQLKVQAIGGDGAAAHRIHRLMSSCESAYRDPQELEAAINRMYETRVWPLGPGMKVENPQLIGEDRSLPVLEKSLRNHAKSCESFTDRDIASAQDWLKFAADLNDVGALMDYADVVNIDESGTDSRIRYTPSGVDALEQAWKQGRVHALHELSAIYRAGSESIQPDRVKASAYLYLNTHLRIIQIERRDPMPEGFPAQGLIAGKRELLDQQMLRLRPSEVDAALEMAEDLLRNNPDCCFDYF